jgi:hypothetical protein
MVARTKRKMIKQSRSKQLYERAVFCKRLAAGAGDPTFAATLHAMADEYEGEAVRAAKATEASGMPRGLEEIGRTYAEHHTS